MSDENDQLLSFILRAMAIFNGFDGPDSDGMWWRTDSEYAPVTLFVNCNDLFYWGCADCETINYENIATLEQANEDWLTTVGDKEANRAELLFVCRVRGMRPQGAYYKYFSEASRQLFDACGPERETGFGNPQAPIGVDDQASVGVK